MFNLGNTKNAGAVGAKEGVEYKVFKYGNGLEAKLLNLDNPDYAPSEGIVELEPLKIPKNMSGAYRHMADVSWKNIRDRRTGFLIGIPLGTDPVTNKIIWETLTLKGKETLDLSIPDQRAKWICIKNSHFYIDSPNFHTSTKLKYKAVDKEKEAAKYEVARRARRKAANTADSLHGEELNEMAMMLGFDPDLMSPATLFMEVSKYVENPARLEGGKTGAEIFMELYDSETRKELGILKRGLATGVVQESYDKGYTFGGRSLGYNEAEVVKHLRENANVKTSIDLQARSKVEGTQVSMAKPEHKKTAAELRIEELERKLAEVTMQKEVETLPPVEGEVDTEYEELLKEARRLEIKSPHLIGRTKPHEEKKALLKEKIAEANKIN